MSKRNLFDFLGNLFRSFQQTSWLGLGSSFINKSEILSIINNVRFHNFLSYRDGTLLNGESLIRLRSIFIHSQVVLSCVETVYLDSQSHNPAVPNSTQMHSGGLVMCVVGFRYQIEPLNEGPVKRGKFIVIYDCNAFIKSAFTMFFLMTSAVSKHRPKMEFNCL